MKKRKIVGGDSISYLLAKVAKEKSPTFDEMDFCTKFLKSHPKCMAAILDRGHAYHDRGKYDKALKDFSKFIQVMGPDEFLYSARANVYIDQKRYKKAKEELTKITHLEQKEKRILASALSKRAMCYRKLKDYNHAINDLRKALKICLPYWVYWNLNDLASIYATCKNSKIRNGKKALDYITKAMAKFKRGTKKSPQQSPTLLDTLAATHARLGKFSDAVRLQKKAITQVERLTRQKKYTKDLLKKMSEDLKDYTHRLKLYNKGKPFTEK